MVPQQDTIQRLAGGNEFFPCLRVNDLLDHLVDGRVLDAHNVVRARLIGRGGAPVSALLVAGQERLPPGERDNVEIPGAKSVLVLRLIDSADGYSNADFFERRLEEQIDALK